MSAKSIATYNFSTLYTKPLHDKLVDELSSIIDFAFEGSNKSYIRISINEKAFRKSRAELALVKQLYKQLLLFL